MSRDRSLLLFCLLFGGGAYFYLAFFLPSGVQSEQFGKLVYNYYFLSLLEGRWDVPAQIIASEGHYDAAGRAFPYHGLAPVITRIFAAPFVDLTKISLSAWSIWLFVSIGALAYTKMFLTALRLGLPAGENPNMAVSLLVCLLIWVLSPSAMLIVNDSLFHEPIAAAYCFSACYLMIAVNIDLKAVPKLSTMILLSVFAGATVYARPNVAVGLYFATVLILAYLLWSHRRAALNITVISLAILFIFGAGLLLINYIRFDDPLRMHGSFQRDALEHGVIFFGFEDVNSPRNLAFEEHGRFNLTRIVPNTLLYLFDLPIPMLQNAPSMESFVLKLHNIYDNLTANLGYIRNESPKVGVFYLWMPWFLLIFFGLFFVRKINAITAILLISTGTIALLITSYGTITLRYRSELWPLIAILAWMILPNAHRLADLRSISRLFVITTLFTSLLVSLVMSISILNVYSRSFAANSFFKNWPYEECAIYVANKDTLGESAIDRICTITEGL